MKKLTMMALVALLTVSTPAIAGKARRARCQGGSCPTATVATIRPTYYQPVYRPQQAMQYRATEPRYYPPALPSPSSPPTSGGFLAWLNSYRASRGLHALAWDQELANWAASNNAQQRVRGIGHFVMGPARRQNAAMGANYAGMWAASPAHNAALLDPSVRSVGLASDGTYATANLR